MGGRGLLVPYTAMRKTQKGKGEKGGPGEDRREEGERERREQKSTEP